MKKLAIVVPGQGMACVWAGGVVAALAKEHNLKFPNMAFASSGSAGVVAYYITGQHEILSSSKLAKFLSDKKFIRLSRFWKVIDIDYLIDVMMKKIYPLDEEKIYSSPTNYLISAANFKTGELKFFSSKEKNNIFEIMRATKALPVIFGKRVEIEGNLYCDIALPLQKNLHVQKAIEMGATHIILIDSNNYRWQSLAIRYLFRVWKFFRSKEFKKNFKLLKEKSRFIDLGESKLLIIRPEKKLKVSTWTNSANLLFETAEQGYNECKNNKKIGSFLKDFYND